MFDIDRKNSSNAGLRIESRISHTRLGRRSMVSAGVGSPTVVFESGLGSGKESWSAVFNDIAAHTHAVAYDRAGYGRSENTTASRDPLQMVSELRALLREEQIPPPYVLVGHSLGGMLVKLFARAYPTEVAGVVLVDARHSDFSRFCKGVGLPRFMYEPPAALFMLAKAALRGELKAAAMGAKQVRKAGPFPPVPLVVLTQSSKSAAHWPKGLSRVWAASQRHMVKMSVNSRIVVCEDAGHHVHRDRPDAVVGEVLAMVSSARAGRIGREDVLQIT